MKKLSVFAIAFAAFAFAACTGQKSNQNTDTADSLKSFEQEQIEASIKVQIDSISAELGKLQQLPFLQENNGGLTLTKEEKQVKPEYLLDANVIEEASTLAEKYRILSALSVDKSIAKLYEMPTEDYEAAITKLAADIDDPSFKVLDDTSTIYETGQKLYDAMNENGRINYFWQLVASSLVEEIYVISQNTEKFITAFDDDSAANVTFRIVLLSDAVSRLAEYDPEFEPVANAVEALSPLNAISVSQLKAQLEEAKEKIAEARANLLK